MTRIAPSSTVGRGAGTIAFLRPSVVATSHGGMSFLGRIRRAFAWLLMSRFQQRDGGRPDIHVVAALVDQRRSQRSGVVATLGRHHKRGPRHPWWGRLREASVRAVEHPVVEAGVWRLVRDALVAECRAGTAPCKSARLPMQSRFGRSPTKASLARSAIHLSRSECRQGTRRERPCRISEGIVVRRSGRRSSGSRAEDGAPQLPQPGSELEASLELADPVEEFAYEHGARVVEPEVPA